MTGTFALLRGDEIRKPHLSGELKCAHEAEPQIGVPVARFVVVTIGRAQVLRIVVPATATDHAV